MRGSFAAVDAAPNRDALARRLRSIASLDGIRTARDLVFGDFGRLEGQLVLDVGCGCGYDVIELARRGAEAIGLDASETFLALARSMHRRGAFLVGDAQRLPLDDESIDAILISRVLMHVAEPQLVLSESGRCLRPNGRIAVIEPIWEQMEISGDPTVALALKLSFGKSIRHGVLGPTLPSLMQSTSLDVTRDAIVVLAMENWLDANEAFAFDEILDRVMTVSPDLGAAVRSWLDRAVIEDQLRVSLPLRICIGRRRQERP